MGKIGGEKNNNTILRHEITKYLFSEWISKLIQEMRRFQMWTS